MNYFQGLQMLQASGKKDKNMLLSDVQLAMCQFSEYLATLINKRYSIQSQIDSHV